MSITLEVLKSEGFRFILAKFLSLLNIQLISRTFLVSKLLKSKVVKLPQPLNILSIPARDSFSETFPTFAVSNFDKSSEVTCEQPSNISVMSVTLLVSNLDINLFILSVVITISPENMSLMLVTFAVVKLSEAVMSVNLLQPRNILAILVTLAVLNSDKSNSVMYSQPLNIPFIFWTLSVTKVVGRFNLSKLTQAPNIYDISVTFDVLKLETSNVIKLWQL